MEQLTSAELLVDEKIAHLTTLIYFQYNSIFEEDVRRNNGKRTKDIEEEEDLRYRIQAETIREIVELINNQKYEQLKYQ